jgi:hypothetical protein
MRGCRTGSCLASHFTYLISHLSFLILFSGLAVLLAYQPAASYRVDISQARSTAELSGVYLPERNDQFGLYRWTPGQITIHLRPIGGPLHVRVRSAGWRPDNSGNPRSSSHWTGSYWRRPPGTPSLGCLRTRWRCLIED